jgi:hypothetical protein
MATETLWIDEKAYTLLARARILHNEFFSRVIKRDVWNRENPRCEDLLVRAGRHVPDATLNSLAAITLGKQWSLVTGNFKHPQEYQTSLSGDTDTSRPRKTKTPAVQSQGFWGRM